MIEVDAKEMDPKDKYGHVVSCRRPRDDHPNKSQVQEHCDQAKGKEKTMVFPWRHHIVIITPRKHISSKKALTS
jgi:hypothetical protein